MKLTDQQYREAAWCEAIVNQVQPRIAVEASLKAKAGKQFDDNIAAAIQAKEWLERVCR